MRIRKGERIIKHIKYPGGYKGEPFLLYISSHSNEMYVSRSAFNVNVVFNVIKNKHIIAYEF